MKPPRLLGRRAARGVAAIEFALLLPLIVAITGATLQLGVYWAQCNADAKAALAVANMAADIVGASPSPADAASLANLYEMVSHDSNAADFAVTVTEFTLGGTGWNGAAIAASSSTMLSIGTLSSTDPSAVPQVSSSPVPLDGGDIVIVVEAYHVHGFFGGLWQTPVSYARRVVRAREPTPWLYVEVQEIGTTYYPTQPHQLCVYEVGGEDASGNKLASTLSYSSSWATAPASRMADGSATTFGCTKTNQASEAWWAQQFTTGPSQIYIDPYCKFVGADLMLSPTVEILVSMDGVDWGDLKTVAVNDVCSGHKGTDFTLALP